MLLLIHRKRMPPAKRLASRVISYWNSCPSFLRRGGYSFSCASFRLSRPILYPSPKAAMTRLKRPITTAISIMLMPSFLPELDAKSTCVRAYSEGRNYPPSYRRAFTVHHAFAPRMTPLECILTRPPSNVKKKTWVRQNWIHVHLNLKTRN